MDLDDYVPNHLFEKYELAVSSQFPQGLYFSPQNTPLGKYELAVSSQFPQGLYFPPKNIPLGKYV